MISKEPQPRSTAEKKRFSSTAVQAIHQRLLYACCSVGAMLAASLHGNTALSGGEPPAAPGKGLASWSLPRPPRAGPGRPQGPGLPGRCRQPGSVRTGSTRGSRGAGLPPGHYRKQGRSCASADSWRAAGLFHPGQNARSPAPRAQTRTPPSPQRSARGRVRSEETPLASIRPSAPGRTPQKQAGGGKGSLGLA